MKKRIFALVLAVVMVASASMAIYAGVNGFGGESEYIAAEATLDCCAPEFTPDGCPYNTINGGGSGPGGGPLGLYIHYNPHDLLGGREKTFTVCGYET